MVSPSKSDSLPRPIRFAAITCMVLAALTGWAAISEATELAHFFESRSRRMEAGSPFLLGNDPADFQRLLEAQYQALEPMREPRALLMGVMAIACAVVFVSAGRILRPHGMPAERIRLLLGRAAIAVAVLRTIDGAQWAVVARRTSHAVSQMLIKRPEYQDASAAEMVSTVTQVMSLGFTVAGTALIAGTFALLGQFFRSDSVREALGSRDRTAADS
ncbi:hypothetical protein NVS55_27540 [Myxococcus stipitatus]|uniref:hypothetical protein n=1 Tax=Myxococcus stipitatus TaxID=83455 RepID=UPI0031452D04